MQLPIHDLQTSLSLHHNTPPRQCDESATRPRRLPQSMERLTFLFALLGVVLSYPFTDAYGLELRAPIKQNRPAPAGPIVVELVLTSPQLSPLFTDDPISPEPSDIMPDVMASPFAFLSVSPSATPSSVSVSPTVTPSVVPTITPTARVASESPSASASASVSESVRATPSTNGNTRPSGPPTVPADQLEDGPRTTCFAAKMRVRMQNGALKRMDQVQVGEWVQVAAGVFEPVLLFTHRVKHVRAQFVRLVVSGSEILLTEGHFVYVGERLVAARDVKVGDLMPLTTGWGKVELVERVMDWGLYNVQTHSGDVVVEDVRVSTYTEAIRYEVAHALLVPVRAGWRLGLRWSGLDHGWPRQLQWLATMVGKM